MKRTTLDRVVRAYRPLYLRGALVEGPARLPPLAARRPGPPRLLLLALIAAVRGRSRR